MTEKTNTNTKKNYCTCNISIFFILCSRGGVGVGLVLKNPRNSFLSEKNNS